MSEDHVDFGLFIVLWNRMQGQATPRPHRRMAKWLEACWINGDTRLLLMAFRSCGKSTIVGLFAAWLLYRNPDLRILVLAADSVLAGKMVRNVRRIIERHPLTLHLRPETIDQWASDRFTVRRGKELRDPSMLGVGIGGNMTGSRADIVICDDVEVPDTCDSAAKREDLRERLGEIDFVLVPGGTRLYIGTPHSWFTIYADAPRREIGETVPFLDHFQRFSLPLIENGQSAWPERYPMEDIDFMRRQAGPHRFASQMLLQPVNIAEGRLDPAQLTLYDAEPVYNRELGQRFLMGKRIVSTAAWWDPSFGAHGGDGSVVAVVFTDEDGMRYLHRTVWLNRAETQGADDEAARQCAMVTELAHELSLPYVAVETNGLGKFLPAILRREITNAHVVCAVRGMNSTQSKDRRILEAFDVLLAARLLHVHASVYETPFITEMQEWRPSNKGRDDGLDAAAGALSLEPVRLKRPPSRIHTADTNFTV